MCGNPCVKSAAKLQSGRNACSGRWLIARRRNFGDGLTRQLCVGGKVLQENSFLPFCWVSSNRLSKESTAGANVT